MRRKALSPAALEPPARGCIVTHCERLIKRNQANQASRYRDKGSSDSAVGIKIAVTRPCSSRMRARTPFGISRSSRRSVSGLSCFFEILNREQPARSVGIMAVPGGSAIVKNPPATSGTLTAGAGSAITRATYRWRQV